MSRKTVFCRIDEGYIEICRNPEECSFGEECKNFGEVDNGIGKNRRSRLRKFIKKKR